MMKTLMETDEKMCRGYKMKFLQMVAGTQDEVVAVASPHHCHTCR